LIDGFGETIDDVLFVDVGGSVGHDVMAFWKKFPDAKGALVVEDLEEILEKIEEGTLDADVRKVAHDFFTPQPIKGK
jgi:hypothetical protein